MNKFNNLTLDFYHWVISKLNQDRRDFFIESHLYNQAMIDLGYEEKKTNHPVSAIQFLLDTQRNEQFMELVKNTSNPWS